MLGAQTRAHRPLRGAPGAVVLPRASGTETDRAALLEADGAKRSVLRAIRVG